MYSICQQMEAISFVSDDRGGMTPRKIYFHTDLAVMYS